MVELGKQQVEATTQFVPNETKQLPSYAAAVKGRKAQNLSRQIPPTFITQGPGSVKIGTAHQQWQPVSNLTQGMPIKPMQRSELEQAVLECVQPAMQVPGDLTSTATNFTANQQQLEKMLPANDPNCTSIHVKGIPDSFNNQHCLKEHFSEFGQVMKIQCNPTKLCATVTYKQKVLQALIITLCIYLYL